MALHWAKKAGILSQFARQKWPCCNVSLKCIAFSCDV